MAKFPDVVVDFSNQNGNAFAVMGIVIKAMRRAKVSESDIEQYKSEAMSGDYNNLLRVTMEYVEIEM